MFQPHEVPYAYKRSAKETSNSGTDENDKPTEEQKALKLKEVAKCREEQVCISLFDKWLDFKLKYVCVFFPSKTKGKGIIINTHQETHLKKIFKFYCSYHMCAFTLFLSPVATSILHLVSWVFETVSILSHFLLLNQFYIDPI